MKIKVIYILYIINIILIVSILYYNKCNVTQKELLTKNVIFDIIEDVENIVISCITKSGNSSLSAEDKLDFAINYIIENKQKYCSNIYVESLTYFNNEENILIGKVDEEFFRDILESFFLNSNYPITEYKFYKDRYVELRTEPKENICWDEKECIKTLNKENRYYIYIKYTRILNDIRNDFYVEYAFDVNDKIRIDNVTIYDSIIS